MSEAFSKKPSGKISVKARGYYNAALDIHNIESFILSKIAELREKGDCKTSVTYRQLMKSFEELLKLKSSLEECFFLDCGKEASTYVFYGNEKVFQDVAEKVNEE